MSDARDEQEPRPPSWRALITGLPIALIMTTIMVTTYVSAQREVVTRDLPGQMPAFHEQAARAAGTHLGVVPGIAVCVLLVAGCLGSTLAMQRTGAAAARRLLSLTCYAIIASLLTVVIVVFFGNPATGGVNGTACLPAFWQYLHGNAVTQPLVVLSVYVVVGAALVVMATYGRLMWWRGGKRRHPISPEEEGGIAALPPA
ncbi:hypothetical protein [Streptomyces sp. NPDC005799]|uniref:hypothetical protein n=1 Tax=Streptomyces sp. NPDC005799 TaxID=3154678 RepID=UPI0033F1C9B4